MDEKWLEENKEKVEEIVGWYNSPNKIIEIENDPYCGPLPILDNHREFFGMFRSKKFWRMFLVKKGVSPNLFKKQESFLKFIFKNFFGRSGNPDFV